MTPQDRVYVAGHTGLVGSSLMRRLREADYSNLVVRHRHELDLKSQGAVDDFFRAEQPEFVLLAAAKVGGILANDQYRGDFIRDNLLIQTHVLDAAQRYEVERLLFLGSSCIYPRNAPQPMREEHLLTGPLEQTNEPYSVAKIAGVKMCEAINDQYGTHFLPVMPTNLYGPNDNFDLENSHVLAAFIRKFGEAAAGGSREVTIWGTGKPRREFLYVDDLADACVFLMEETNRTELINVGVGEDITIRDLAELVADVVGFDGRIVHDTSKPDGAPRKLLDVTELSSLGWEPDVGLREGIEKTWDWYRENASMGRN